MKRLNAISNRHPILSIIAGFLVLVVITLVVVPADPPSADAAMHERAT